MRKFVFSVLLAATFVLTMAMNVGADGIPPWR
jgi:hypothetical protein